MVSYKMRAAQAPWCWALKRLATASPLVSLNEIYLI